MIHHSRVCFTLVHLGYVPVAPCHCSSFTMSNTYHLHLLLKIRLHCSHNGHHDHVEFFLEHLLCIGCYAKFIIHLLPTTHLSGELGYDIYFTDEETICPRTHI